MDRPGRDEYAPFYGTYVKLVPEPFLKAAFHGSLDVLRQDFEKIPNSKASFRYQPDKWRVSDVLRHCADTERIFAYRALCIARCDERPLAGFDEVMYANAASGENSELDMLKKEMLALREGSVWLFESFRDVTLLRRGNANGSEVTVRALGYMMIGHWRHHQGILRSRYGLEI